MQLDPAILERFWSKVQKTDSCWLWTAAVSRSSTGYGAFKLNNKKVDAHRLAYELQIGPIPAGMFVCHSCDVRTCVRGDHLWIGRAIDNVRDMHAKGRYGTRKKKHGLGRYEAGCRCEVCRAAKAVRNKRYKKTRAERERLLRSA